MTQSLIHSFLKSYKEGQLSEEELLAEIAQFNFVETGTAKLDLLRKQRVGVPEAVFCEGKSISQLKNIFDKYESLKENCLFTRLSEEKAKDIQKDFPLRYGKRGRIGWYTPNQIQLKTTGITIITAGSSDRRVGIEAMITAMFLGNRVTFIEDCGVAGLQRLLEQSETLMQSKIILVVAGMEGALTSVVGGITGKPVIGVPTSVGYGVSKDGEAALRTMLSSCAPTVAVVNIDNGFGAACVAHAMLQNKL